ncbi:MULTISPECIES: DNA alkylation repair protein [Thioclava]|uniref:DNA alkylation repair protein n=1 Tax=Thioclava litoralis TaxID=3076557 RepID=A0ABZ1E0F7_9RHOB|nr:DNA alkylation repair protein [Thioclava sp. FTW29]
MSRKRGGRKGPKPEILQDDGTRLSPEETAKLSAEAEAYAASDADYEFFEEEAEPEDTLAPPSIEDALYALEAWADAERAAQLQAQTGTSCRVIGVTATGLTDMAAMWREALDNEGRVSLANELWQSGIYEARIAATKLLTQARMRPDDMAWQLLTRWIEEADCFALIDALSKPAAKRLQANLARLSQLDAWANEGQPLSEDLDEAVEQPQGPIGPKLAIFLMTRPYTKLRNPKPEDHRVQDHLLTLAARLAPGAPVDLSRAIGRWLADLAKFERARVEHFLATQEHLPRTLRREAQNGL